MAAARGPPTHRHGAVGSSEDIGTHGTGDPQDHPVRGADDAAAAGNHLEKGGPNGQAVLRGLRPCSGSACLDGRTTTEHLAAFLAGRSHGTFAVWRLTFLNKVLLDGLPVRVKRLLHRLRCRAFDVPRMHERCEEALACAGNI